MKDMKQNKLFPFYVHVYFTDSKKRTKLSSLSWEDAGIFMYPALIRQGFSWFSHILLDADKKSFISASLISQTSSLPLIPYSCFFPFLIFHHSFPFWFSPLPLFWVFVSCSEIWIIWGLELLWDYFCAPVLLTFKFIYLKMQVRTLQFYLSRKNTKQLFRSFVFIGCHSFPM